jgi:zona occludens toxin
MITLITGAPGSGKTAALVQLLQQFAKEGRAIFADGIPDLKLPHLALQDPKRWHVDVPDGSVIVIDEVQRIWRPAAPGAKVTPDIEHLETHRHKGIEFYLITQHPNLLHANVRRLVGRHIHLRDVGVLGRWWYEWPEAVNPESWKSAPIKQRYKLPRSTFAQYKSASLHVKPIRKIPPALIVAGVAILGLGFLAKQVYGRISETVAPVASKAVSSPVAPVAKVPTRPNIIAEPVVEPAPVLVGCIHLANRCECITERGVSAEVELKLCHQSAERSGTGVPYSLQTSKSLPHASRQPVRAPVATRTSL